MSMTKTTGTGKLDAWFQQAHAWHEAGRFAEAEPLYRKILRKRPANAEVLYLLGTLRSQQGELDDSSRLLERAIALRPRHAHSLNNYGLNLRARDELDKAIDCFQRALAVQPDYTHALNNLASALAAAGRHEEALDRYRTALDLDPDYVDAHYNLGLLLVKLDRYAEARARFERGLELAPEHADAWNDLGTIHKAEGRLSEARRCVLRALELRPDFTDALNNLGAIQQELGEFEEALGSYQGVLAARPGDALVNWNLAQLWLSLGETEKGWAAHAWRWRVAGTPKLPFPEWDGDALGERTLLVYAEQGLGDEIMFASCVPDLIQADARCVLECDPRLAPLFARSFPSATVMGAARDDRSWLDRAPAIDLQCAIGSLPCYLRPDLSAFPDRESYLVADPERVAHWRRYLADLGPGLKVGLCWRSGLLSGDRRKYYPTLEACAAVLRLPGVRFVNLQYDRCDDELEAARESLGVEVIQLPGVDLKNDLDEVAAIIAALDAVVSATTSVAELAGALGLPVYRFDAAIPWTSFDTATVPWHPTVRAYSKVSTEEPWEPTMDRIAADLSVQARDGAPPPLDTGAELRPPLTALSQRAAASLLGLALDHFEAGRPARARAVCERILGPRPADTGALHLLALALQAEGRLEEALEAMDRAVAATPEEPTVHCNRGSVRQDLGRLEEAVADYRRALALGPDLVEARVNLGSALLEQGELEAAAAELGTALAADPGRAPVHRALAQVRQRQGRPDEAQACLEAALDLRPDWVSALNDLGAVLRDRNRLQEAEHRLCRALELGGEQADVYNNLASTLMDRGRTDEALACYRRAAALRPGDARLHWNLAYAWLTAGELTAGWEAYEWRWQGGIQMPCRYPYPEWDGSDPTGRTVLVYAEQGVGDEILFASCFRDLMERAGHCVLECDPRLAGLFRRAFPGATVHPSHRQEADWTAVHPGIDVRVAAGSLPRYLRRDLASFPAEPAYLEAEAGAVEHWTRWLVALGPELKVGLSWRSGLASGERARYYSELKQWATVLGVPGVRFINLQYDECTAELATVRDELGVDILPPPGLDLHDDLDGLAALMAGLDLVIAAPNTVAELAGALGVPCWRLDPSPTWTSLGTDAMPWHPTLRLHGKGALDRPWEPVLEAMGRSLSHLARPAPCRHGALYIDDGDPVGRALLRYGEHEEAQVALLDSLVGPGQVVVEVGAGCGAHTLYLAAAVGPEGAVAAFEDDPWVLRLLQRNLALNGVGHAFVQGGLPGRSGCPVPSLDALGLARCDLLKLARGPAPDLLRGARETLVRCKPFVYLTDPDPEALPALGALLQALGYEWRRHDAPRFNPANLRGCTEDAWGGRHGVSLLAFPVAGGQGRPQETGA